MMVLKDAGSNAAGIGVLARDGYSNRCSKYKFFSRRFYLLFILKLVLPWRGLRLDQSHDFQDVVEIDSEQVFNAVKRSFHHDIWEIYILIKEIRQVERG